MIDFRRVADGSYDGPGGGSLMPGPAPTKRPKVECYLGMYPHYSDRAIAELVGCSDVLVGRIRARMVADGEIEEPRRRIGRDGVRRRAHSWWHPVRGEPRGPIVPRWKDLTAAERARRRAELDRRKVAWYERLSPEEKAEYARHHEPPGSGPRLTEEELRARLAELAAGLRGNGSHSPMGEPEQLVFRIPGTTTHAVADFLLGRLPPEQVAQIVERLSGGLKGRGWSVGDSGCWEPPG